MIRDSASERALRAPAISRKVSFGSHRETGARLSAVLFSLFATLALAGINRHHWDECDNRLQFREK